MFFSYEIIELTHTLDAAIPTWNGSCGFHHDIELDYADCDGEDKFRVMKIKMHAGIGTHMDAPSHYVPEARCVDDFTIDELCMPCVVIKESLIRKVGCFIWLFLFIFPFSLMASTATQNLYSNDLDFIYESILENHPGVYNQEDPDFCQHAEKSYTMAQSQLKKSRNDSESKSAISTFTKSFNDTHLQVSWRGSLSQKQDTIIKNFSAEQLSDRVEWISLPTFYLTVDQEKAFQKLLKNISELDQKEYIVFDLRGNKGGNSEYGLQIVQALFGKEYVDRQICLHNQKVYVDWRVSKGNVEHIRTLLKRYPNSTWLQNVEHGLIKSLKRNDIFYREYSSDLCAFDKNTQPKDIIKQKIIVIIDAANVSAALDFIDQIKMIAKNIVLIGQTTRADRLYMEVRVLRLPSDQGDFCFPIKVYHNRARLDNQPYFPDIEFNQLDNTAALHEFILEKITKNEL